MMIRDSWNLELPRVLACGENEKLVKNKIRILNISLPKTSC